MWNASSVGWLCQPELIAGGAVPFEGPEYSEW
jgi:hypothetical protein